MDDMGAKQEVAGWPDVVRLSSDEQKVRLARLEEAVNAKMGANLPRTTVLEMVINKGLDEVEPAYGVTKAKK